MDGTNAARRGSYDPRFPEMEELRLERFLSRLALFAAPLGARVRIEVFLDGPRRPVPALRGLLIRFAPDTSADDAILGSARCLAAEGRGAVVVTADGRLAEEARAEGARVISFSELEDRLRSGKA